MIHICLHCESLYAISPYGPYCRRCGAETLDEQPVTREQVPAEWSVVCGQAAMGMEPLPESRWEVR